LDFTTIPTVEVTVEKN